MCRLLVVWCDYRAGIAKVFRYNLKLLSKEFVDDKMILKEIKRKLYV